MTAFFGSLRSSFWSSGSGSGANITPQSAGGASWGFDNLGSLNAITSDNTIALSGASTDDGQNFEIVSTNKATRESGSSKPKNLSLGTDKRRRFEDSTRKIDGGGITHAGQKRTAPTDDATFNASGSEKRRRVNDGTESTSREATKAFLVSIRGEKKHESGSRSVGQATTTELTSLKKPIRPPPTKSHSTRDAERTTTISARPQTNIGSVNCSKPPVSPTAHPSAAPSASKTTPITENATVTTAEASEKVIKMDGKASTTIGPQWFTAKPISDKINGSSRNPIFLDDESDEEVAFTPIPATMVKRQTPDTTKTFSTSRTDAAQRKLQQEESDRLRRLNLDKKEALRQDNGSDRTLTPDAVTPPLKRAGYRASTQTGKTATIPTENGGGRSGGASRSTASVLDITTSALSQRPVVSPQYAAASSHSETTVRDPRAAGQQNGVRAPSQLTPAGTVAKEHTTSIRQMSTELPYQQNKKDLDPIKAWQEQQHLEASKRDQDALLAQKLIDEERKCNVELVKAKEKARQENAAKQADERARKETAATARKEADARREAEACARADAKRKEEEVRWAAAKKAEDTQKQRIKQAQEKMKQEADALVARQNSLATLMRSASQKPPTTTAAAKDRDVPKADFEIAKVQRIRQQKDQIERRRKAEEEAKISPPKTVAPKPDSMCPERQRRMQIMEERKKRNSQAEAEQKPNQDEILRDLARMPNSADQLSKAPATADCTVPQSGPVSLNSAAGQARLAQSSHISQFSKKNPDSQRSHPNQIIAEDIWIMRARDDRKMLWPEIMSLYQQKFKTTVSDTTLRRRYQRLKEVMANTKAHVPVNLLDSAEAGH